MRNYKAIVLTVILGGAILTGCASWQRGDSDRTAGRIVDDRRITANIERGLSNEPVYKFTDVDVRTFQGVVQLSGFVGTENQKERAGRIAENIPGVSRVVNSIVLKPESDMLTPTGRSETGQQQQRQQQQQDLDRVPSDTTTTDDNRRLNQ